jgi:hypothetical protein
VIPLLVGGAIMPELGDLPEDLRDLRKRNAVDLRDRTFDRDVEDLMGAVDRLLGEPGAGGAQQRTAAAPRPASGDRAGPATQAVQKATSPLRWALAAGLAVAVAVAVWAVLRPGSAPSPTPEGEKVVVPQTPAPSPRPPAPAATAEAADTTKASTPTPAAPVAAKPEPAVKAEKPREKPAYVDPLGADNPFRKPAP